MDVLRDLIAGFVLGVHSVVLEKDALHVTTVMDNQGSVSPAPQGNTGLPIWKIVQYVHRPILFPLMVPGA